MEEQKNTNQEIINSTEEQPAKAGNPTATDVKDNAKSLTGEQVLKHIMGCKEDSKDVLKKVPYRVSKNEQFLNVLNQIKNDQEICIKYIEILEENIKTLERSSIGNLAEALEVTKNRLSAEKKMVEILSAKNPFGMERTEAEIKTKKLETLYALNAYSSMSRTREDVEWDRYQIFTETIKPALPESPQVEKSTGFDFFSFIVLAFILFVVFKRSSWAKSVLGQVLKKVNEPKDQEKPPSGDQSGDKK